MADKAKKIDNLPANKTASEDLLEAYRNAVAKEARQLNDEREEKDLPRSGDLDRE